MNSLEIVGLLCLILDLTSGLEITLNKNAVNNGDLQILIDTGTITNSVILNKPDGSEEGRCLAPFGGTPGTCSANFAQSGTITTVDIATVSRATHEGVWTSIHGSDTGNISIAVLTVPTTLIEQSSVGDFEVTSSTSETFTVGVECVYPSVQIDWEFVTEASASTGVSPTRGICTDNGPTGGSCTDPAANSSSCDFVVTEALTDSLLEGRYKLKANLFIDGQYTSTGVFLELSTIIIIKERICECNAVLAIAIIGIIVFVVDVILTWIAHFQLLGNITCPLSLVTKSKSSEGKFKWKTERSLLRAVVTTGICVIALILCIIGIAVCKACQLGSPEQSERTGLILAAIGFAINLVVLILLIIMIGLNRCRVLTISSSSNPDRTETNQVNPENENVTDDQKNQHKMEKADVIKATSEEMKGIDKTEKVDSV